MGCATSRLTLGLNPKELISRDFKVNSMQTQTATQGFVQAPQVSGVDRSHRPRRGWLIGIAVLLVFAGLFVSGVVQRLHTNAKLRTETADMAIPSVSVVSPQHSAPSQEIVLPGNVQPYVTAPIYSRTNGYLQSWYFDIGAHVSKGQLLAIIASPEVDQQLGQSRSNLETAQANLKLAEITKNRYLDLLKTHAVSQQDADNAVGTYTANKAIVDANQANVKQLQALQSFEKIYAPFDGIITARNTDVGALIDSGSAGGVKTDMFHLSQADRLRVYVNVPEEYSQATTAGLTAELTLAEFPGRQFTGKLVRTSEAINYATRTLTAEVDVRNPTGQLLSGSYAEVHFKVPGQVSTYLLPANALLFRKEGLRVAVVQDGKAQLIPVTPGRDFGDSIEIVSGLHGNESVIVNPPDSITDGEKVQVESTTTGGTP
jgi:RND family efflux transporter MFP subunit